MPAENFLNALSKKVIGASIEVHRQLGPGLLEAVYVECMVAELAEQGISKQTGDELNERIRRHYRALDIKYNKKTIA